MRAIRIAMLVLALAMVAGKAVAMLPPDTFKDPIFAAQESESDDGGSDSGYTEFA